MHHFESLAFHNSNISHAGRRILNPVQFEHPGENVVIQTGRTARTDTPLGGQCGEDGEGLPYGWQDPHFIFDVLRR
jgi:hypothetical protein